MAAALILTAIIEQPLYSAQPADEREVKLSQLEHRLVKAVNAHRAKHRLAPLERRPSLNACCATFGAPLQPRHRRQMVLASDSPSRFPGWATDDIANGYLTPEEAVEGWATSHGHEMQMRGYFKMNGRWQNYRFNRIGVGISGRKYIAIFGRADESRKTLAAALS